MTVELRGVTWDHVRGYGGVRAAADAYAGVRPLISTGDPKKSVDISRKAELYETSSGMITITGGKLTTWRRMAKLAVDRIVERDGRDAPCRTHEIPLGMAVEESDLPHVEGVRNGFLGWVRSEMADLAELRYLLAQVGESAERVDEFLRGRLHLQNQWTICVVS
mgnify:CR=1 FL=1